MATPLTCGIVGFGYMGEIRKRVADADDRLQVIGIVEPDESKAAKFDSTLRINSFQALIDQKPDILFVCTPNKFAPEIAIAAMRKGIHVFCEKPPGRTVQDIESMMAAERPGIKLMFGFNHRFHPAILKAKAVIDTGRMGKILSLRGLYGKSGGVAYEQSWRNDADLSGGGILLDQGIHMLDLFRLFCEDFDQVKCFTSNSYWDVPVEDNAYVLLRNSDGQHAIFHSSATLWKHTFRIEITLEHGYMVIEGLLSKSGSYGRESLTMAKRLFEDEAEAVGNPPEEVMQFDKDLSWELEVETFIEAIQKDEPVTASTSYDALRVMQIIESAYHDAANQAGAGALSSTNEGVA